MFCPQYDVLQFGQILRCFGKVLDAAADVRFDTCGNVRVDACSPDDVFQLGFLEIAVDFGLLVNGLVESQYLFAFFVALPEVRAPYASPASVGFAVAVCRQLLTERNAIADVLLCFFEEAVFLVELCQSDKPVVVRCLAHDVALVGQRNFKITLCDFVFALREDGDETQDTLVINTIYVGVHFFSLQFLMMSMPIAMSAKLALHIAIRLAMTPAQIMAFTVGCLLALLRSLG